MQSIQGKTTFEFIEKKSRFIGILIHVEDEHMVNEHLTKVRSTYPGATHYVYAYIINQTKQKASDDGEPQRTAGYPVLDVLKKNQMNDCLAIVIRYFGGIKLGAGGLIRAYAHAISETIQKATFVQKVTRYHCSVSTTYDKLNSVLRILQENTEIIHSDYQATIEFSFYCYDQQFDFVKNQLFQANHFEDHLKVLAINDVYAKISDSYIQTKR